MPDFTHKINLARASEEADKGLDELIDYLADLPELVTSDDPIPRYAQLDVWMALFGAERSQEYEAFRDEHGFAETWSWLLAEVRTRRNHWERSFEGLFAR